MSLGNRQNLGLVIVLLVGLLTRVPHLLSYLDESYDSQLTYLPTLASARFEECARALLDGSAGGDAFSYASPLYILFLVPFYLIGSANVSVYIAQSAMGVGSGVVLYLLSSYILKRQGTGLSVLSAILWFFYAPAAFYETTLLPLSLLACLISLWVYLEIGKSSCAKAAVIGLVSGIIAGLRPNFVLLGLFSVLRTVKTRNYKSTCLAVGGLIIPLLVLSVYHSEQGGGFTPFPASTGLNLVLGHADGASGYGPPVAEYGLYENPNEDIHQVAARIARESGYSTRSEANRFWAVKAISWIAQNPDKEMRLIGIKLGAVFGMRAFDTYFDLERDIQSDRSLGFLLVPRWALVLFTTLGGLLYLFSAGSRRVALLPMAVVIATSVVFVHSERYWLPAVPATLAAAAAGYHLLCSNRSLLRPGRTAAAITLSLLLLIPGLVWTVPRIPEGTYLYNRGIKALNTGNSILALNLFESAAEESEPGTTIAVYSLSLAAEISLSLGLHERAYGHYRALMEQQEQ